MLQLSIGQMAGIEQRLWFARMHHFIQEHGLRADFRDWARDRPRLDALWRPLWQARGTGSEHDVALAMMVAAMISHARLPAVAADRLLRETSSDEVAWKAQLADRGYFRFTAFDLDGAPAAQG